MDKIPVFQPCIDIRAIKHILDALDAGWLGMGAYTKEFEDRIAAYLGLGDRYVVLTNTGTSALHIALIAANVGFGDEVITPSFNYVADHQAIRMTGAEVVMCDISDDNLGIDCEKAETLITEKTKAIIPLHFAGIPCDLHGVYRLAAKYGLRVIEDSMHAFGTCVDKKKLGSFGDITCFSFDPVKIVTSVDGGCVIVNDKEEFKRLQRLRLLGVDKDTTERYKNNRAWDYDVVDQGYRYHLTNIMASIGISQIKQIDNFIQTRREVCCRYNEAFDSIPLVNVPATNFNDISPFIYYLRVEKAKRQQLIEHLNSQRIEIGIHFVPVHKHTHFSNAKRSSMEVTEQVSQEIITLPLHSNMRPEAAERIIIAIQRFYG